MQYIFFCGCGNGLLSLLLEQDNYGIGFLVQPFGDALELALEFPSLTGLYQVGCLEGEAGQHLFSHGHDAVEVDARSLFHVRIGQRIFDKLLLLCIIKQHLGRESLHGLQVEFLLLCPQKIITVGQDRGVEEYLRVHPVDGGTTYDKRACVSIGIVAINRVRRGDRQCPAIAVRGGQVEEGRGGQFAMCEDRCLHLVDREPDLFGRAAVLLGDEEVARALVVRTGGFLVGQQVAVVVIEKLRVIVLVYRFEGTLEVPLQVVDQDFP